MLRVQRSQPYAGPGVSPHGFRHQMYISSAKGLQRQGQIGQAQVRLIDAGRMVALARQALLQDPTIFIQPKE